MILGNRIRLRAMSRKDLPDFVNWLNDPEVLQYLSFYTPLSIEQEEKWYEEILTHPVEEHPLVVEARTENDWMMVGNIGFNNVDQHERSAEVGIFIGDKAFHNKGYGTEALCLIVDYGFMTLNFHRIYLRVYANNPRGVRCYEKVGFKQEGRMREAHFFEGRYIDILLMSILKDEWKKENMKEGSA